MVARIRSEDRPHVLAFFGPAAGSPWGDETSLKDLDLYLLATAPWKQSGLVEPICYSPYLAFDAATDPLPRDGDSCEVTSKTALDNEIGHLMAVLDSRHIVGGRIDMVAHSMGGLPAASPTAFSAGRSPMVIVLKADEPVAPLRPEATYPNVGAVRLAPNQVTSTVEQSAAAPVISLQGGVIRALRPGTAKIEARFGGAVDRVKVIVKPNWE